MNSKLSSSSATEPRIQRFDSSDFCILGSSLRIAKNFCLLFVIAVCATIVFSSNNANACSLILAEDSSASNQKRMRIFINSNSELIDERVAVGKAAAETALRIANYDFVDVFVSPLASPVDRGDLGAFSSVAWVQHAPDPSKIPFMTAIWGAQATSEKANADNIYMLGKKFSNIEVKRIETDDIVCSLDGLVRYLN